MCVKQAASTQCKIPGQLIWPGIFFINKGNGVSIRIYIHSSLLTSKPSPVAFAKKRSLISSGILFSLEMIHNLAGRGPGAGGGGGGGAGAGAGGAGGGGGA